MSHQAFTAAEVGAPGDEPSAPQVVVKRDCFGGERIVEIRMPAAVTLEALDRIAGARTVLSQLPRPFFRIDVPGHYLVSGILGDTLVRFTVRLAIRDDAVEHALAGARRLAGLGR